MPKQIQRRRTAGWRMPAGAVYVGHPSPWGNPFPVDGGWITWMAVAMRHWGLAGSRCNALAGAR